jgi:hypothetical protein
MASARMLGWLHDLAHECHDLCVPKSGQTNRTGIGWTRPQVAHPSRTTTNHCDRKGPRGVRGMPPALESWPAPLMGFGSRPGQPVRREHRRGATDAQVLILRARLLATALSDSPAVNDIDGAIDRLRDRLRRIGARDITEPGDTSGLQALSSAIRPLQLPEALTRWWETVDTGSLPFQA